MPRGSYVQLALEILHIYALLMRLKFNQKIPQLKALSSRKKTAEYSVFKLLLTGVDDSSFIAEIKKTKKQQNQNPKIELLDQLVSTYTRQLGEEVAEEDLANQLDKIELHIKEFQDGLSTFEISYQNLLNEQHSLNKKIDAAASRRSEIDEINARFKLLNGHYTSDLQRLEGIREAGSLLGALEPKSCPLCGASPDHQHPEDTSGNLETIVAACLSEEQKIKKLQSELISTIKQLDEEAASFDNNIPLLHSEKVTNEAKIKQVWDKLSNQRVGYSDLLEKRSDVRQAISLAKQIKELRALKIAIENESKSSKKDQKEEQVVDFSTTTLTDFEVQIESILKEWNFPDSERVKFDEVTRDLIISGKKRASRGKGMRSITHSAFTIGILEFCKAKSLNHPGFVILDSPLLAYREPEDDDNDLVHANVQDKFYDYLSKWTDRQIIIIENVTPPLSITNKPFSLMFTKNDNVGRYGFFPV